MNVFDFEQGGPEWIAIRLGIPTVSAFHRIITPARADYSTGADAYIAELLAERHLGQPLNPIDPMKKWENALGQSEGYASFTQRGQEMEAQAVAYYEMVRNVDVQRVGFVMTDEGDCGGSPDGLVGEDGGLEIKCRSAGMHIKCVLGLEDIAKRTQVQGSLWLTGRKWWDVLAYNPAFPPRITRIYRDETFIDALDSCLTKFGEDYAKARERFDAIGPDGVVDDNLMAQLVASLKAAAGKHPEALSPDEIDEVRERIGMAVLAGVMDDADSRQFYADVCANRWDDVRTMAAHLGRVLKPEPVA